MSEMTCLHCGATSHNGLVLCELCRYKAGEVLASLPVHFRNLARWKPGRAGSRQVPGSTVLYDGEKRAPTNDRVSTAVNEAGNDITTWARALADDRSIEVPDGETEVDAVVAICTWLAQHLVTIGTLEWAGEFTRSVIRTERRLSALTAAVIPGWYAGQCQRRVTMEDACGAELYVVPGLRIVTCAACGSTTFARDHLEVILDEASEWTAPPIRLAEAIVALVDTEMSVFRLRKRIGKWGERKQLQTFRRDNYAPRRYRLGEVMDRLRVEGETRLDDDVDLAAEVC